MNKLKSVFNSLLKIDNKIYNILYKYKNNFFIDIFACLGNIIIIILIIIIVFILPIDHGKNISIVSFVSLFLNTFVIFIIKFTVRRKRVYENNPLLINIETYSFPSGHINRISSLIIPFYYYPFFSLLLLIFSIAVGFARMAKGYHFLSDCVVGFLIGIVIGYFANLFSYIYIDNVLNIFNMINII